MACNSNRGRPTARISYLGAGASASPHRHSRPRPKSTGLGIRGVLQNCYNSTTGPQQAKMLFSTCCRPAQNLLWARTAPQQPLLSGLLWGCFGAHNKACSRGPTYNSSRTPPVVDLVCSRPAVAVLSACFRRVVAASSLRSRPCRLGDKTTTTHFYSLPDTPRRLYGIVKT